MALVRIFARSDIARGGAGVAVAEEYDDLMRLRSAVRLQLRLRRGDRIREIGAYAANRLETAPGAARLPGLCARTKRQRKLPAPRPADW